jgi:hypothetical protein
LNPRSRLLRGFIEKFEQLRENEKEKKILLASKSGAHIEWIHEKNRDQKFSRYCPFKFLKAAGNLMKKSAENCHDPQLSEKPFTVR